MDSPNYWPVAQVITDGEGHFIRIDTCSCTPGNEGDDLSCLVHGPDQSLSLNDEEFVSETMGGDL